MSILTINNLFFYLVGKDFLWIILLHITDLRVRPAKRLLDEFLLPRF